MLFATWPEEKCDVTKTHQGEHLKTVGFFLILHLLCSCCNVFYMYIEKKSEILSLCFVELLVLIKKVSFSLLYAVS